MAFVITVRGNSRSIHRFLQLIPSGVEVRPHEPDEVSLLLRKEHYPFVKSLIKRYNLRAYVSSGARDTLELSATLLRNNLRLFLFSFPLLFLLWFAGKYFPLFFLFCLSVALVKREGRLEESADILEGLPEGAVPSLLLLFFPYGNEFLSFAFCALFSFLLPALLGLSLQGRAFLGTVPPGEYFRESLSFSVMFSFSLHATLTGSLGEFVLALPFLLAGGIFLSAFLLRLR